MKDDIEDYIDKHGVSSLLDLIADICSEKEEHVRTTWQDMNLARAWGGLVNFFRRMAESPKVKNGPAP